MVIIVRQSVSDDSCGGGTRHGRARIHRLHRSAILIMNSMEEMHAELDEYNEAKRDVAEKGSVLADVTELDRQLTALKSQLTLLRTRLTQNAP